MSPFQYLLILSLIRIILCEVPEKHCIFLYDLFMDSERLANYVKPNTVKCLGPGELIGYQLDFAMYSKVNFGCLPTIAINSNQNVWGVVYEVNDDTIKRLDEIKGVWLGISDKIKENIRIVSGGLTQIHSCFLYYHKLVPGQTRMNILDLPQEKFPSGWYMDQLFAIAVKYNLDIGYLDYLAVIPHNQIHTPAISYPSKIIAQEIARINKNEARYSNYSLILILVMINFVLNI